MQIHNSWDDVLKECDENMRLLEKHKDYYFEKYEEIRKQLLTNFQICCMVSYTSNEPQNPRR